MTVWTPKRILIMVAGFFIFLAGYVVYAHFLGGIDGLPPLPAHYLPGPNAGAGAFEEGNSARKFTQAFGKGCPEKDWPIKLDLPRKRWIMASVDLKFLKDGRVRLTPFSAANFPRRSEDIYPEISTVQCEEAYLTLDQPVTNLTEMSSRKVVSVELRGKPGITIINNRGTEKKNDDIELQITKGPLFFDDQRNMIWTEGMVQLLDTQTEPHPTRIRAEGMDLFLTEKDEDGKPIVQNSNASAVGGIEKLILRRHVEMHLYVDSGSGFMGNAVQPVATPVTPKPSDKPPEKSHVIIRTRGAFTYLVPKDNAWFDSPEIGDAGGPTPVQQVHLLREHKNGVVDQLLCSKLQLQFRSPKRGVPSPDGKKRGANKQIESAHATSRNGHEIVLTMDSENLEAYGDELFYQSPSAGKASMTVLKGKPMRAIKQGHKLRATELHLFGATAKGNDQKAIAYGPGQIDLFDKSNKKDPYPMHALWKDRLISEKDLQAGKWMDLLTLIGDASFRDEAHDKELYGHRLLVWLEPTAVAASAKNPPAKSASPSAPRHRPFKLEAFGNVMARSPKLLIPKADYLKVLFKDHDAPGGKLPAVAASDGKDPQPNHTSLRPDSEQPAPKPVAVAPNVKKEKPARPMVLIARQIVTYVNRVGSQNILKEVVTEGKVHVHQEPERGKDNGVDIKGEMLHLVHHPQGDTLYVFGDSRKPAMLTSGKMELMGPKVTINQRENIAHVAGGGALKMPSNTTFDGKRTENKDSFMRIHWNESMWFYGSLKSADFYGGVQAFQDNGSMKCKTLQVTLDRVVSFKEGQEKKGSAKIDQLVCDGKVLVLDEKRDANGKRVHLNRLEAYVLTVDNEQKFGNATGPGRVFLLSKGKGDPVLGDPKKKSGKKEQMYLTRIHFFTRMYSIPGSNSRTFKFFDNVHVYYIPSKDPFVAINPDKLPDGGFYLHCNLLTVLRRQLPDGKKSQEMQGQGNVSFRTKKFFGRADMVKYDESKQQVIFQGKPGSPATLYEFQQGLPPKLIKGLKILYDRKTGKFLLDHSPLIQTRMETPRDDRVGAAHTASERDRPHTMYIALPKKMLSCGIFCTSQQRIPQWMFEPTIVPLGINL